MRFLQICPKPPRPLVDGGCIAMDAMTKGLLGLGHDVSVIAMATQKHPHIDGANNGIYESIFISTKLKPLWALINLIANKSYNVSRFRHKSVSSAISKALKSEDYDVVILESIYACCYIDLIRNLTDAQIVLRAHNIEHKIWDDLSEQSRHPLKSWYLNRLARQLETFEYEVSNKVDSVIGMTKNDLDWFKDNGVAHVYLLPFSMDFLETIPRSRFDHVFHLGSMDWMPNVEGVTWLIDKVWPLVREKSSDARLVIAGRNMPPKFSSEPSMGIEVLGEVESSVEFLDRPGIAAVPVLSGSGMRIKAVEALAAGLPVVGTELGLTGLGLENGKNAMIANTPKDFASSIIGLLTEPSKASKIGQNGNLHARERFETKLVFKDLIGFFKNFGKL